MSHLQPPAAIPGHIPLTSVARPAYAGNLPYGFDMAQPGPNVTFLIPAKKNPAGSQTQAMLPYRPILLHVMEMALCFLNRLPRGVGDWGAITEAFNRICRGRDPSFRRRGWNVVHSHLTKEARREYNQLRQRLFPAPVLPQLPPPQPPQPPLAPQPPQLPPALPLPVLPAMPPPNVPLVGPALRILLPQNPNPIPVVVQAQINPGLQHAVAFIDVPGHLVGNNAPVQINFAQL